MQLGDHLGFAGIVVGLVGIALTILWPTKRWVGALCLAAAVMLGVLWGGLAYQSWRHPSAEGLTPKTVQPTSPPQAPLSQPPQESKVVPDSPSAGSAKPPNTPRPGPQRPSQANITRHLLSKVEQGSFEAPLLAQTDPKQTIILNCPANEENDCAYAFQFVDYFRAAGFTVDGNMVHRITLRAPYYGVVLGLHVDKDVDPNQPLGTGAWVQLTPTYMNVVQAFVNIQTGTVEVSGSQVPSGALEIYFGPERQPQDEEVVLQQSIQQAKKYEQVGKYLAAIKKARQRVPTPPR